MTDDARPRSTVDILLVDDSAQNRRVMREVLAGGDYRLVEAASGEEALVRLVREEFALILLDVTMPGMSGFEVASLVRARHRTRSTPIIFVTGQAANIELIYEGYATGAVDYLIKPLDARIVRAKVEVFAELHRQRAELRRSAELLRQADRKLVELKIAELALAQERRHRRLTEAIPQIVWTAARDGSSDYFNERWYEYTGLSAEESAKGWWSAVHADDRASSLSAWEDAVRAGSPCEIECRLRRRDGVHRWHVCRAVPERGSAGGITGWLATLTDIDDNKRLLDEQTRLYRAAALAVQARDEFLSLASHELKTPIATLQLRLQAVLRKGAQAEPEWARSSLAVALRQVVRLNELVDELLDVSRIRSGRLRVERERVDLSSVARDVIKRLEQQIEHAGCRVDLRVDAPVAGDWDPLRIEQILTNLLANAVKYGAGKPITVTIRARDDRAVLAVRDEGVGIPAEDHDRVFECFEHARTAAPHEGLGLGLYLTRQIVVAHGGTIRLASAPGAGSTFTVELPLTPPNGAMQDSEASPNGRTSRFC